MSKTRSRLPGGDLAVDPVPAVGLVRGLVGEPLPFQGEDQVRCRRSENGPLAIPCSPPTPRESMSRSMPRYTVLPTPLGPSTPMNRGRAVAIDDRLDHRRRGVAGSAGVALEEVSVAERAVQLIMDGSSVSAFTRLTRVRSRPSSIAEPGAGGEGAAEPDVFAAVELGLAGDELAGGLGRKIRVEARRPRSAAVGRQTWKVSPGSAGDRVRARRSATPRRCRPSGRCRWAWPLRRYSSTGTVPPRARRPEVGAGGLEDVAPGVADA